MTHFPGESGHGAVEGWDDLGELLCLLSQIRGSRLGAWHAPSEWKGPHHKVQQARRWVGAGRSTCGNSDFGVQRNWMVFRDHFSPLFN